MRLTPFLVAVAAMSLLAGLLGPWSGGGVANATTESVGLRVNPGPEFSPDNLNCLWHEICGQAGGNALDWKNNFSANETIYWRSYGFRTLTGNGILGSGTIVDNSGTCSGIRVHVADVFGYDKGNVLYTHQRSWTYGSAFQISASPTWSYSQYSIGFSWSTELPDCVTLGYWTGQHLHQGADAAYYAKNAAVFTSTGSYPVDSFANWQYSQSWVWNY